MGYSAEVIRRARARLAQAKADRESENEQHLRQAYARVPRLREIDKQLRITMAMAAQAAFASGGDFNTAMEQVRDKNLRSRTSAECWWQRILSRDFWTSSPSAIPAAAAAMWEAICASA